VNDEGEAGVTMKAAVLEEYGLDLVVRNVARPVIRTGQVLVQVVASGVNPIDTKLRAGGAVGGAARARVGLPAVLGLDVAGVVVEVGPGVTRFAVGDEVYGLAGGVGDLSGSLAEYVAADADLLARKPSRLSMAEAAALPLAVITAWEALVDKADVHDGHRVLVHGGAGGVGHVAIQLALARGAEVFATGSPRSLETIRHLGAVPIDYAATAVGEYVAAATGGAGFDVVLDTVGGTTLDASFEAVLPYTGRVVSILGWGTHSLAPLSFRGATYSGVFTLLPLLTGVDRQRQGEILAQAAALVDAGRLSPILDPGHYDLDSVMTAHKVVESRAASGKVVVKVGSEPAARR
jgi:NADPH:quinone reductase-like Zn-dependent oxidoreductase